MTLAGRFPDVDPAVVEAADAWSRGRRAMAPPSLRVYLLSKALGAPLVDVMAEPYELFRELEVYVAAQAAQEARRAKAQQRKNRGRGR